MAEFLKTPTSDSNKKSIGQYILGRTLGEGTFGKVRVATHILTGEKVAIKILEKDRVTDVADVERVAREIHILKIVRHPNLIQLYEIVETTKQLYLVTEYVTGGELYEYIVANNKLKEPEACRIFQQIISGVEYIHKLHIVHRDLKPENLMLDNYKNVKLGDFGLSNTYKEDERLKTACGSPCYAAPEMIAGKKYNGLQVDIWSVGVVLFALLCGHLPFEDPNTGNLYKKILNGDYTLPAFLSAEAKQMVRGILNTDPQKRFTIEDIRGHAWYKQWPALTKEGIIVGVHQIPTEPIILKEVARLGLDPEYTKKCVEANKHNAATTTYYLLLQKFVREGGKSPADLSSPLFEPVTIGKRLKTLRDVPQLDKTQIIINDNASTAISQLTIPDTTEADKRQIESNFTTNEDKPVPRVPFANCDLLNSKLNNYVLNLSLNLVEQQRKKLCESIDLNATIPVKGIRRHADKEDRRPARKSLSTRGQGLMNVRLRRRIQTGKANAVTPSAAKERSVKRSSCSPNFGRGAFSRFAMNKTCRPKKCSKVKTPSRRLK
eukprot:TRINITY_DN6390_c0_g1_i2.p1 TRINITY_DN6390_c0_g1~~TRINITY_DN6390_c0_g1_i2.p1  ORF type:complete len:549 (-),score=165.41 TRINITY_DN6390_c0_g1_i2:349-1995(-)